MLKPCFEVVPLFLSLVHVISPEVL